MRFLRSATAVLAVHALVVTSGSAQPRGVTYISNSFTTVDIVLVAHQDDWQLFMGDAVASRIRTGSPVVIIYLTAGDDGRDSLYWATRESAALESTRAAVGEVVRDSVNGECSTQEALKHLIRKCTIANTNSYFLRLPDGRRNGAGFDRYSRESLRKLRTNRIKSTSAVDGSASYRSWADLMSTVNALIGDRSGGRLVTVHTSDPSKVVNPHDHYDHRMAGLLVADLRRKTGWNVVYYAGYALASRAPNRSTDQAREKTALFTAYNRVMTQVDPKWSAFREHPAFYSECMVRTYGRSIAAR